MLMVKPYKSDYYNSKGGYRTRQPPNNKKTKACQLWENIKNRCEYLPIKDELRFGKYSDVDSCPEWKDFQNFAKWFEEINNAGYFHEGWQLDKDLLVKGNKIYCPEFCTFLPEDINKALNTKSRNRGELPLGICYAYDSHNKVVNKRNIQVTFACKNSEFALKLYMLASEIEEGFALYKEAREKYIRHLAETYKHKLDPRAYEALIMYEVNIDD